MENMIINMDYIQEYSHNSSSYDETDIGFSDKIQQT